jgi:hypothetical protein
MQLMAFFVYFFLFIFLKWCIFVKTKIMARVTIDIERETDLEILLPLLKRLQIPYLEVKETILPLRKSEPLSQVQRLQNILTNQKTNPFAAIKDPLDWQKKIRDEWE